MSPRERGTEGRPCAARGEGERAGKRRQRSRESEDAMGFFDKIFFGPFCSLFCTGMSIFGIVTLITLGSLIKSEYAYTGVYFENEEARSTTVSGCFTAAVVYVGFLVWSGISFVYNKRKKRI